MTERPDPHMTAEKFRRPGHAVVDWVADCRERVEVRRDRIRPAIARRQPAQDLSSGRSARSSARSVQRRKRLRSFSSPSLREGTAP
jgi:hypothetical protein